ncbi:acyl-CoA dehydratase activase [Chloroflexota bacterium]
MEGYLGIDVGSVTTKLGVLNESLELEASVYLLTRGNPIAALQEGLSQIRKALPAGFEMRGAATTGSARYLAGVVIGADLVKNEITSHAVAALHYVPEVRAILEIGGQDSKIIIIKDGIVIDFGMNTVCAAGTGSFLDHQALRLNMSIEELSTRALDSCNPVRIAGRCTVFAESDMIHKQQMGHALEDIVYGLCQALVRNYLNNVGSGKDIQSPVVFQGGVAFNKGIVKAFQEELNTDITVLPHHELMGAIGAALLVHDEIAAHEKESNFRGFGISDTEYSTSSFSCQECPNQCEIAQVAVRDQVLARYGGRCDRYETGEVPLQVS